MKETVKPLTLIILFLFILLPHSYASELALRFAYIKEPALFSQSFTINELGRVADTYRNDKDITSFEKITRLLFKDKASGRYSLHRDRGRNVKDSQSVMPFHKQVDKYGSLSEQTKYLALILTTASITLYMMPEDFTNWSREGMKGTNIFERWERHIKSRPVWDNDHWAVNYIGHTYAGSAYYILARHNGLDWKEAGLYSTLVSTFMWEYGVELTGEVPSIQDLIVTPVGGVLLGELLLQGEEVIKRNGGRVLGSKFLGDVALVLIDPAGSAIRLLKRWTSVPARIKIKTEPFNRSLSRYDETYILSSEPIPSPYYGMRLVFTYE